MKDLTLTDIKAILEANLDNSDSFVFSCATMRSVIEEYETKLMWYREAVDTLNALIHEEPLTEEELRDRLKDFRIEEKSDG